MADGQLLARQRDVDDLLAEPTVELLGLEPTCGRVNTALNPCPDAVEQHAGLAIPNLSQRLRERAFAADVFDPQMLDVIEGLGLFQGALELLLVRLPVHGGDCNFVFGQESSSFAVAGRARPGMEREVRRRAPGSRFRTGAR